jgi:hypothetical protein
MEHIDGPAQAKEYANTALELMQQHEVPTTPTNFFGTPTPVGVIPSYVRQSTSLFPTISHSLENKARRLDNSLPKTRIQVRRSMKAASK